MSSLGSRKADAPVPAQDPRNRGRYIDDFLTVAVMLLILITGDGSAWLWALAGLVVAVRAWRFQRDLQRWRAWRASPQ
jgi:hypothetical protein